MFCLPKTAWPPTCKTLWSKYNQPVLIVDIILGVAILGLIALLVLSLSKAQKTALVSANTNYQPVSNESTQAYNATTTVNHVPPAQPSETPAATGGTEVCGLSGPLKDVIVKISSEPVIFGRDPRTCKVLFPSNFVQISRIHCSLSYDSNSQQFVLEDLGSTTGTFLSTGERLTPHQKVFIYPGDSFYLGNNENLFEVWKES